MDSKKLGKVLLIFSAVVFILLLIVLLAPKKKEAEAPQPVSIGMEIADPDVADLPTTKQQVYESENSRRNKAVEEYWDLMAGDGDEDDPMGDLTAAKKQRKERSDDGLSPVEELFGFRAGASRDGSGGGSVLSRRAARERTGAQILADSQQQQLETIFDIANAGKAGNGADDGADGKTEEANAEEKKPEEKKPEREKIDVDRVKVVHSAGMSTFDDAFGDSSGFSTLTEEEREEDVAEDYPFKCMFIKDERLKSSQRVTIRLLEDIIVDGKLIRKNTHLYGVCNINDRVDISVPSLDLGGKFINLNFEAYDSDGVKGLYAPDVDSDTAAETMKNSAMNIGKRRLGNLVGATTRELIEAGSVVISGKGKDRSVFIPAGYHFYLVKKKK